MKTALQSAPVARPILHYVKSREHLALAESYLKQLEASPNRLARDYRADGYGNALGFLGPEKFRSWLGPHLLVFQYMFGRLPLLGADCGVADFVFDQKYFGLLPLPSLGDKLSVRHRLPDDIVDAVRLPEIAYTRAIPELPPDDAVPSNVYFIKKRAGCGDYLRIQWPPSPEERDRANAHLAMHMQHSFGDLSKEWWYLPVPHEWFMEESVEDALLENREFRVWMVGGEVLMTGVTDLRSESSTNFYDASMNFAQSTWSGRPHSRKEPLFGSEHMLAIARQIAARFPFIRVDFMVTADRPFLGELSVCPGNAHQSLQNAEIDQQFFHRAVELRNAWYERWCGG